VKLIDNVPMRTVLLVSVRGAGHPARRDKDRAGGDEHPGPGDQPTTSQALITRATYSPLAPFFDRSWRPSEIEAVKTNP
jgi:hypothetical protein